MIPNSSENTEDVLSPLEVLQHRVVCNLIHRVVDKHDSNPGTARLPFTRGEHNLGVDTCSVKQKHYENIKLSKLYHCIYLCHTGSKANHATRESKT